MSTPVGFEPTQGDPIGLAGRRLNHSAKVSVITLHRNGVDCYIGHDSLAEWSKAVA